MILFLQSILLVVLLAVVFGPMGHGLLGSPRPELLVLTTWTFAWFGNRGVALRWALLAGVVTDLVSFLPFGVWTGGLVVVALLTDAMKSRFFDVSSLMFALITLAVSTLIMEVAVMFSYQAWSMIGAGVGLVINVLLGIILYYVLAIRMVGRWTGRRL